MFKSENNAGPVKTALKLVFYSLLAGVYIHAASKQAKHMVNIIKP